MRKALSSKHSVEATLAILKPDVANNPWAVQNITQTIRKKDFVLLQQTRTRWTKNDAEKFYEAHAGRFFHRRLVESMTSGPIIALVLARVNAVAEWRDIIGGTKVCKTKYIQPYSIRGEFGLSDTRNSVHGSDSMHSAVQEINAFFPSFDVMGELEKYKLGKRNIHENESSTNNNVLLGYNTSKEYQDRFNSQLGLLDTWNKFYNSSCKTVEKDWFIGFNELKPKLLEILGTTSKKCVVDIGCGTSSVGPLLSKLLHNNDVYCVDGVEKCLLMLKQQYPDYDVTYVVANVCKQLPFAENNVDLFIDKGTFDSIIRQNNGEQLCKVYMTELFRVLKYGGKIVQVTTDEPEQRLDILHQICGDRVNISYEEIESKENGIPVFIYIVLGT
uniref:uncharacterized protein LOC100185269 n=1 Tax=Ciona intestinalis TaxID=7719 RepID=UPI000180B48B|nr:uncharacterized protein LOC100185269 [Ciona intestinalis]|eukprot:XP_002129729.1 uncharacterized protein LOC100185269 [Ciona intestinalis]